MPKTQLNPPKTRKPVAVAIASAPWPAWMPRPTNGIPPNPVQPIERTDDADPRKKSGGKSDESRTEQVRIVKIIGKRMKEARAELAGFSQIEAAKLLGYKNSSKLAKIEGASDTDSVPLPTIVRAAELYDVSIDFLFGLSTDWERSPQVCRERAIGRWLHEHLERERTRDALAFTELREKVDVISILIPRLADGAEQAKGAFEKFQDMNPCYEDLIGGARLKTLLESLDEAGRQARLALRRLHIELDGERAGSLMDGARP